MIFAGIRIVYILYEHLQWVCIQCECVQITRLIHFLLHARNKGLSGCWVNPYGGSVFGPNG